MTEQVTIYVAVEGDLDEWVARRLVAHVGASCGPVYGKKGISHLRERIQGYNHAAHTRPWLVLVDLDRADCPPALRNDWLPHPAPRMCFRIAVRAIEAWLLADRSSLAQFLGVSTSRIPRTPEELPDPKQFLINLASQSRKRAIREGLVPGQGQRIGPAYNSYLIEFVRDVWNVTRAASNAPSLQRALHCLQRLIHSSLPTPPPGPVPGRG
jgi:hypothetical protein